MPGIVKIYRPKLSEKEKLMREQSIKAALQQFGKDIFESEVRKNGNNDTSKGVR